jgi:hypothetical protein
MIRDESSGALLGRSLGTGLGQGLAALLDSKMKAIQRSNFADLLGREEGLSGNKGQILAEVAQSNPTQFAKLYQNMTAPSAAQQTIQGKPFSAYAKDSAQSASESTKALRYSQELRKLNKSGQLSKWFGGLLGDNAADKSFKGNVAALEAYAQRNPLVKKLSNRLKPGDSQEAIDAQIDEIEKEFNNEIQRNQAINDILQETGGEIPSDFEDILNERMSQSSERLPQEKAPEQAENGAQDSGILNSLLSAARVGGGIAAKGIQGLGEGVTGLAAAPFNIANLVSGGNIPVPQAIQSLEQAPEAIVKGLTGDLTNPQSDLEESIGDTVKDIASFLSPAGLLGIAGKGLNAVGKGSQWLDKAAKFLKIPLKTAAATSGLANTAKFLTKKVGFSEGAQEAAKIGTMLAVPILGSRFMGSELKKLSQEAASKAPEIAEVSFSLAENLNNLFNKIGKIPENALTKTVLEEINKNQGLRFSAPNLMSLKGTLTNSAKTLGASFKDTIGKSVKEIDGLLGKIAQKSPEFAQAFDRYQDLSNALNQSNKVANFAQKYVKIGAQRNPVVTALFAAAGLPKYKTLGLLAGGGITLGEIERFGQMLVKSPEFRNSSAGFLNAAAQGSVRSALQYAKQLDKESKK